MTTTKYVDFSKLQSPITPEIASRIMQEVAFGVGIGWKDAYGKPGFNFNEYPAKMPYSTVGYAYEPNLLFSGYADGESVSLSAWLTWIVAQGKPVQASTPARSWLDDVEGKQVLVWDNVAPGMGGMWRIATFHRYKEEFQYPICTRTDSYKHCAKLSGHEERAFLPYDRWPGHEEEV